MEFSFIKHDLISVGAILLLGLLGGWAAKKIKLPHITGYFLIGFLTGPYVLGLLTAETIRNTHIIIDIALGFVLYAIGGQFDIFHLKNQKKILILGVLQSIFSFLVMFFLIRLFNLSTGLSLLIAAIGISTAPAIVLLVVKDFKAEGPLTHTTLMVVAISNVMSFLIFSMVLSILHFEANKSILLILGHPIYVIFGSLLLGTALGYVMALIERHIHEEEEMFLLVAGGLMMSVGLALSLHLSPLFVALMVGATTRSIIRSQKFHVVDIDPMAKIFYIALFVYAGAELDPSLLPQMGWIGVVFILARSIGKIFGTYIGAQILGMAPAVKKYAGIALIPMAGMAIGLTDTTIRYYPEIGHQLNVVILSAIFVFEAIGPLLTEFAILKAGEAEHKFPQLPPEDIQEVIPKG